MGGAVGRIGLNTDATERKNKSLSALIYVLPGNYVFFHSVTCHYKGVGLNDYFRSFSIDIHVYLRGIKLFFIHPEKRLL
jgi:hypothetical protein